MESFLFKLGDKIKIIANHNNHCFDIGEVVTVTHMYGRLDYDKRLVGDNRTDSGNLRYSDVEFIPSGKSIRGKSKRNSK